MAERHQPIRVAHVVGKMVGGGVESVVMNYYRHICRSRVQFDFLVDMDSTLVPREEIESLGGRVFEIPPYQHLFEYQRALVDLLCHERWQIIHSHINTLSVFSLGAARRAGVPVRIAHSHATAGNGELVRNLMKYALKPFANFYPTHRLACSEHAGRWLFANRPFDILVNAFDVDGLRFNERSRMSFRERYGIPPTSVVFGHAGRFAPPKNQAWLIGVFSKVAEKRSEAILVLAGQGPDFEVCRERAKELQIEKKIIFIGQCNDMVSFYSGIDIFLLPSTYEGLGLVLVEAQAAGLPCLASSSIPREANPSQKVVFAEYDDESAWYSTMLEMRPRANRVLALAETQRLEPFEIKRAASWLAAYYENAVRVAPSANHDLRPC